MTKNRLLGTLNVILGLFFGWIFFGSFFHFEELTIDFVIKTYLPALILLLSAAANFYSAIKLFTKKNTKIKLSLFLTFLSIFWFLSMILSSIHLYANFLLIIFLLTLLPIYLFSKNFSKKFALTVTLISFITILVAFFTSFEENYCWSKGTSADPNGFKMITATAEDEKNLSGFSVKEGQQISLAFREHMLCHNSFNYLNALKETYGYK